MELILWKWRKNSSKVVLGAGSRANLFPGSETFAREWEPVWTFSRALDPLKRPIPQGYDLYCARHLDTFPYNTIEVARVANIFYPDTDCLYFLAPRAAVEELKAYGLSII